MKSALKELGEEGPRGAPRGQGCRGVVSEREGRPPLQALREETVPCTVW